METELVVDRSVSGALFCSQITTKGWAFKEYLYESVVTLLKLEDQRNSFFASSSGIFINAKTEQEVREIEEKVNRVILRIQAWASGSGTLKVTATEFQPDELRIAVGTIINPVAPHS